MEYDKEFLNYVKEILDSKPCITIYCGTDWYSHQKKIDAKNKSCVDIMKMSQYMSIL